MTHTTKQQTPGAGTPEVRNAARETSLLDLRMILRNLPSVEDMQRRSVQHMITLATANYWDRRADTFEDARPRPGEYAGQASEDEVRTTDERLAQLATLCRFHASLIREACDG